MCRSGDQIMFLKNYKTFWTPTKRLALFLYICRTLSCSIQLRGMAPQPDHCTEQSTEGSRKTSSTNYDASNDITTTSLTGILSPLNCDDTIFSRNSFNRLAVLGTVCMISSHLLFLYLEFDSLPHPLGPNKTVLLLYKLLLKVLPVITFYVCSRAIWFYYTSISCTYRCLCFHVIFTYIV